MHEVVVVRKHHQLCLEGIRGETGAINLSETIQTTISGVASHSNERLGLVGRGLNAQSDY